MLLNILIGKAGLFQTVPFIGQPVAAVLRQIEGGVDVRYPFFGSFDHSDFDAAQTIANMLIDTVESRAKDLQAQASSLTGTLEVCIEKYEGLSVNKRSLKFPRREIAHREIAAMA